MVQQTQEQWLGGRYEATTLDGGLAFPDWEDAARAFGIEAFSITTNAEIAGGLRRAREASGPIFCRVVVASSQRVIPQVRFGYPLEDGEPFVDRDEFLENMIVKPMPVSLEGADRSARSV